MIKKKKRRYPTPKKRKLLRIISENLSRVGFTKTMTQMMIEAGYKESVARQQRDVLEAMEADLDPIIKTLKTEREKALSELKKKRGKAKYRDLVDAVDKLTRNIQLLSGKNTESFGFSLSKLLSEAKDDNK